MSLPTIDRVTVTTAKCPKCGDIIYSRAKTDARKCSCGALYVTGGFDFLEIGFDNTVNPDDVKIEETSIPASEIRLYLDWESVANKYGKLP